MAPRPSSSRSPTAPAARSAPPRSWCADADTVVVLPGDHPLISGPMLKELLATHRDAGAAATVMTVELDDPGAYGRVVRDDAGEVERIVETKHPEQVPPEILALREISTSTFAFDAGGAGGRAGSADRRQRGGRVLPRRRAAAAARLGRRGRRPRGRRPRGEPRGQPPRRPRPRRRRGTPANRDRHMLAGVTIVDPAATWIDAGVEIAADARIEPGTTLRGRTRVGGGSTVGPHSTLIDSTLGSGVFVPHSYLVECDVADGCAIGPFAYLRPGADLAQGAKAGTFVEVKNSRDRRGGQGPAPVLRRRRRGGRRQPTSAPARSPPTTTVSASTARRSGNDARIGVHSSLVAPVTVGDDAYTGAGAVIREDVPAGCARDHKGRAEKHRGIREAQGRGGRPSERGS